MKDIIVEFSGWARISPEKCFFVLISDEEKEMRISGVEWLLLNEDMQATYMLESVIDVQRDSTDGNYDNMITFEDDDELNVSCIECGNSEMPLHTDYKCPNCSPISNSK